MNIPKRVMVKTLDWADIRSFLIRRKFLRDDIGEEVFDMICQRNTRELSGALMRELSLFIDGYKAARR